VKVVGAKQQAGSVLVTFTFGRTDAASAERLELALFDAVLGQIGK
jgi:hypothetical protein